MNIKLTYLNGATVTERPDSYRVGNGVLTLRRAEYNGGVHSTYRVIVLESLKGWVIE